MKIRKYKRWKGENIKESEPIINEEQSEVLKNESSVVDKKATKNCAAKR